MGMTRREFIGSAGAMVVLGGRWGAAADAAAPQLAVAVVSDTHLGRKGSQSPAKWMQQVVGEINASPAEMTLFLGDLVDSGAKNAALYPEWVRIARGLKKPFHAVPGNHDPEALFTKHVRPETDYVVDHKGWRFILFQDTRTDSHQGTVTAEQTAWIGRQLKEAAEKKLRAILCAHITAHPNKHPDTGWWVRTGGKELRDAVKARRGTAVAWLAGHFHCGLRGWSDLAGVHELVLPSTVWNVNRKLEGAPGFALREFRRGYTLVELHADRLAVRYKPIGADAGEPLVLRLA